MIVCPRCGGDTRVQETRRAKRRRVCLDTSCGARVSTVEVASADLKAMRVMFDAIEGCDE